MPRQKPLAKKLERGGIILENFVAAHSVLISFPPPTQRYPLTRCYYVFLQLVCLTTQKILHIQPSETMSGTCAAVGPTRERSFHLSIAPFSLGFFAECAPYARRQLTAAWPFYYLTIISHEFLHPPYLSTISFLRPQ